MSDKELIQNLCEDHVFRESIESEYGKVTRIYPDWDQKILIYEFIDGDYLHSDITPILKRLREIKYENYFRH